MNCPTTTPVSSGFIESPQYESVRQILLEQVRKGQTVGASISAFVNGREVVNIGAGHIDYERTIPYTESTLVNVFSTSKAITSLVLAYMESLGYFSYSDPVVKYWPEFGK